MKNVIFKGIKALAILFVLYILISLIVPPIFQKEPIELEGAEFAGTGVTERVLCIDDNREALIWRLRLIDRAENEIILSTFDFRVDNSGKDMIAALNEAAERGVNIKILVDGISGDNFTDTAGETYNVCRLSFVCIDVRNVVGGKTVFIARLMAVSVELYLFGQFKLIGESEQSVRGTYHKYAAGSFGDVTHFHSIIRGIVFHSDVRLVYTFFLRVSVS